MFLLRRRLLLLNKHQIQSPRPISHHFHIQNPSFSATISPPSSYTTTSKGTKISATVIDGKSVAEDIQDEITVEISRMKNKIGVVPGLAVILVGDRIDSATYVHKKKEACESVGINSYKVCLPQDCREEEVLEHISRFNADPAVHGILVQLPLPAVCF